MAGALAGIRRWLGMDGATIAGTSAAPPPVKTQLSATVFSGQAREWVEYLTTPASQRYEKRLRATIDIDASRRQLAFQPQDGVAAPSTQALQEAYQHLRVRLRQCPFVLDVLDASIFGNRSNTCSPLLLRVSSRLPSRASREVPVEDRHLEGMVVIVVRADLIDRAARRVKRVSGELREDERLGIMWPVLHRLLSQLGFPNYPRDRFLEKIGLTSRMLLVARHTLFEGRSYGELVPSRTGAVYLRAVSDRWGIPVSELFVRHPYFQLLHELAPLLDDEADFESHQPLIGIAVREYLDRRYLRLSLSGVMPAVTQAMAPMPYRLRASRVATPQPRLGRYGILDKQDLAAWKQVAAPFREMGFTILRQLGIGEFGRVYEALNRANPRWPPVVALKVDRVLAGQTRKTIQAVDVAMQIGRDLAPSPHVIRIYDAGQLSRRELTYHILQFIDGETLDNLAELTGKEHASVPRPAGARRSADHASQEYAERVHLSRFEGWRRRSIVHPFTDQLSLSQEADLLTSLLLWVEKVHELGYAVNDLKNGNLMVSRRGQLKGIDLDAYSPIQSSLDRVTDFLFLSTSLLLLRLHLSGHRDVSAIAADRAMRSVDGLRQLLTATWPHGDVAAMSQGRVSTAEVIDTHVDLLHGCRAGTYTDNPQALTRDIDRFILLKRKIFVREMVLD
jgi:hypothetical protein